MLIIHLKCKLLKYTHSKEEIGRIHVFFFNHPTICCLQETHFKFNNDISLKRMRQWPTACEKAFDGSSRPGRRFTTARGSAASGKAEMKNAATPRAGEDAERRDPPPPHLRPVGAGNAAAPQCPAELNLRLPAMRPSAHAHGAGRSSGSHVHAETGTCVRATAFLRATGTPSDGVSPPPPKRCAQRSAAGATPNVSQTGPTCRRPHLACDVVL